MKIPLATFLVTILSGCTILEPYKWPSGSREIILTFDDGPSRKVSKELLDVLKKHEVKAMRIQTVSEYLGENSFRLVGCIV